MVANVEAHIDAADARLGDHGLSEEEGLCVAYLALAAHRALAAREPRTAGTPYIAPDYPGRFFDALERLVVGERLRRNILQELDRYRDRREQES